MNWLYKIRPWQFLLASVLLTELLVGMMSLLLRGTVEPDFMITGLVASSVVAVVMIYLVSHSSRLRFEKETLQGRVQDMERLFEISDDLICTASMTHFLKINPAGERILGYKEEELKQIPFIDIIHPDDVEPTSQTIEEKLKKGESAICFVNRYRHSNGGYRWLEWMTHPVLEDGVLYAIARDITDRKRMEDELLLLKKSVEMLSTGITISELDGHISYLSPSAAEMHGYTVEELLGRNVGVFMPGGEGGSERVVKTPDEVASWKEWSREIEEVRRDGSVFPVLLKSLPVEDPDGKSFHMITTSEDITQRKRAEKRILLQAQMIELLKDSLVSTDLEGFVKTWNRGAENLFGYTAFEAIGKHISFVYPPEEHGALESLIAELKEKGVHETEARMKRKSGEKFYAILSLSMISDEQGEATGMLGYSIDVTARKQMEEDLRQAVEDKDVLMKEIHHRTKNNMAVIQSLLNLQSGRMKDKAAMSSLNESAHRVKTLSTIHESLYSTGDLTSINIRSYLQSLATDLFNAFGADPSRVTLKINLPDIKMDVDQVIPIGLIVNELLTNVFKYAFPDGKEGEVLLELSDSDEETFELQVADTGIGLPGDLDISNPKSLGLQLVSSLSAQIRGRLSVSSENGTAFRIIFKKNSDRF